MGEIRSKYRVDSSLMVRLFMVISITMQQGISVLYNTMVFDARVSHQTRKFAGCACADNAGNISPPPRISDPVMHRGTCVTHVPWCIPGSLNSGFIWSSWRGKRSRHFRRMCNLQCYVSSKRPMREQKWYWQWIFQECTRLKFCVMLETQITLIINISIMIHENADAIF